MTGNYEKICKVTALIPCGKVASYGQVADLAGLPGRARLVSKALQHAPKELELPWFRIINAQGRISLPKHSAAYEQQIGYLLLEGVPVRSGRVNMQDYQWRPNLAELLFQLDF